jgi:hypothetical protein
MCYRTASASSPWWKSGVAPRRARRLAGKARRPRIPGVLERGATPPPGMPRVSNAVRLSPRAAGSPWVKSIVGSRVAVQSSERGRGHRVVGRRRSVPWLAVTACLATLTLAAGCGDKAPTEPSDVYQGLWTGTISDSDGGAGTLTISLPGGSPLNGTWSAKLPVASPVGFVTSEPAISARRSLALACGASGTIGLDATVDGKTMTGNYLALGCGLSRGSVNLARR